MYMPVHFNSNVHTNVDWSCYGEFDFNHSAFYKQMVNTRCIPLAFAPEEPNAESLEAIREGEAFLASGKEGRFTNGADLIAAATA